MSDERSAGNATQSFDVQLPRGDGLELVVLEQRSVTRRALIPPRTLRIGRADECDVVLHDPGASRQHALLYVAGELAIEDLNSRNGTRVRGASLRPRLRTRLHAGDAVHIGGAILLVQRCTHDGRRPLGSPEGKVATPGNPAAPLDPEMQTVHAWIARVAPSDITVLVSGETGVGKELVAEAIHRASGPRSRKPLIRINCAALSPALLESELFGHERGAFTGASSEKPGLFELADGGTAFLDEVGELPLESQAKFLRVLETREVVRVGGLKSRRVDVRFIAASNRDLRVEIARGAFREDLFFRLHAASIVVPPLRRRPGEIEPLAAHFIDALCRQLQRPMLALTPAARERLCRHRWPGNVRELRNVVECAVLRAGAESIEAADLPPEIGADPEQLAPEGASIQSDAILASNGVATPPPLSEAQQAERERIVGALVACNGNQTRAAERLVMPRRTLVAKLSAYGIPRPRMPRRDPEH